MTAPNQDPRRLRFPEDRTAFVYQGVNEPILSPPRTGLVIYTDAAGTTPADIATLDGVPITNSTVYIGQDFLLPEFLGPTGHVTELWARAVGSLGPAHSLDAQYSDQLADRPMLLVGEGPPSDDLGTYGSMYLDKVNWLMFGPKTDAWPATGTSIRGPQGFAGGTYEYIQVSPATEWVIPHPLAYRPHVTYIDSAGTVVVGDTSYPDPAVVVGTFSAPFAGTALMS